MEGWDSYRKNLALDLKGLHTLLQAGFQEIAQMQKKDLSEILRPSTSSTTFRILNLACGQCDEAETLTQFVELALCPQETRLLFPSQPSLQHAVNGSPSIQVNLLGADIRAREISIAQDRFRPPQYRFMVEDCSKITQHKALGCHFDLVFFRHQNFWNGRLLWSKIFQNALELCSPEGYLVITSYFDREHLLALETFQQSLGATLLTTLRNPASRPLHTPGKSVDRHLAIFSPLSKSTPLFQLDLSFTPHHRTV